MSSVADRSFFSPESRPRRARWDRPSAAWRGLAAASWLVAGIAAGAVGAPIAAGVPGAAPSTLDASNPAEPMRPGRLIAAMTGLEDPVAVAVDASGRVLVLERVAASIAVFAAPDLPDPLPTAPTATELLDPVVRPPMPPGLERLATIGAGALQRPESMVLAPDGRILVSDSAAGAVIVLGPDGTHLDTLGAGVLRRPRGLALTADGRHVVVADEVRRSVIRLAFEAAPGAAPDAAADDVLARSLPARPGRTMAADALASSAASDDEVRVALRRPVGVAAFADGRLAFTDAGHGRVVILDPVAGTATSFGERGPFPGLFEEPVAIWPDGDRLLVVDRGNHRLQEHGRDGRLRAMWGIHARRPHEGGGVIHDPAAIAVDPGRRFVVIAEPFEDRVQVFARDPASSEAGTVPPPLIERDVHFGRRVAADGPLIVLAEPEAHRVHLFDARRPTPIVVGDFGERGEGFGLLLRPEGLALDAEAGLIHVGDAAKQRLQRFRVDWDPEAPTGFVPGRFRFARSVDLAAVGSALAADGDVPDVAVEPADLLAEPGGGVLVVDSAGDRLVRFDERLRVVNAFGGRGTEPGRFRRPTSVARSPDGTRLYVVDADNHRVQVLDAMTGAPLDAWGTRASSAPASGDDAAASARFRDPFGVAVADDGTVWVSDRGAHRVTAFTPDGRPQRSFGGQGPDDGDLWKPGDLAVRPDGRVLVVDYGNHRAKLFEADGRWWATFGTGKVTTRDDDRRGPRPRPRSVPRGGGGGSS